MDCPSPIHKKVEETSSRFTQGIDRWYRDGYMARLNGKRISANPKGQNAKEKLWTTKAQRWENGWWDADTAVNRMCQWDREQEIINSLATEVISTAIEE